MVRGHAHLGLGEGGLEETPVLLTARQEERLQGGVGAVRGRGRARARRGGAAHAFGGDPAAAAAARDGVVRSEWARAHGGEGLGGGGGGGEGLGGGGCGGGEGLGGGGGGEGGEGLGGGGGGGDGGEGLVVGGDGDGMVGSEWARAHALLTVTVIAVDGAVAERRRSVVDAVAVAVVAVVAGANLVGA